MNDRSRPGPQRTVFQPSPLKDGGAKPAPPQQNEAPPAYAPPAYQAPAYEPAVQRQQAAPDTGIAPPQAQRGQSPQASANQPNAAAQRRRQDDDVPLPNIHKQPRNLMLDSAQTLLALVASVRGNRVALDLANLHKQISALIANFEAAVKGRYPEEVLRRARYAVCATADDVAMNVPGREQDTAQWARRTMIVRFFGENIGGDRFWRLLDEMIKSPGNNLDLLELYHACMAAGMEGRYRVQADGRQAHQAMMQRVYQTLEVTKSLSMTELSPQWRGLPTAQKRMGFWLPLLLALAAAIAALLFIFLILRLILAQTGGGPSDALRAVNPAAPLKLSREATAPPTTDGAQLIRLRQFLAPEIREGLVVVVEDATTVRVRTTVGQLFASGSDQLDGNRVPLFQRIASAVETEPGPVRIEGYTDSDRVNSAAFPDNTALSQARSDMVAQMVRRYLSDANRVTAQGYGDANPIASNETADGKSQNRRVEIVIERGVQQ
jgi:type VI secretion system protein ImpK